MTPFLYGVHFNNAALIRTYNRNQSVVCHEFLSFTLLRLVFVDIVYHAFSVLLKCPLEGER